MKNRLWTIGLAGLLVSGAARAQTPPAAEEAAATSSTKADPSARFVTFMTTGLGVVGIGVGATFGIAAITQKIQSNKDCNEQNACNAQGAARRSASQTNAEIATASLIGGAALLGTGVLLILSPPRALPDDGGATSGRVRLELSPSSARLVGTF